MSETVNKNMQPEDILKAFIENRYGSKVYEAYSAAIGSGEIKSVDDAASFLDKSAKKVEGRLLTEPQLERHDEKVIDEIRRLLGEKKGLEFAKYLEGKLVGLVKYFGIETELKQEDSKESGKRLTKKCVEDLLKEIRAQTRIIALAVGYTQSEYIEREGIKGEGIEGTGGIKKLNPDYFTGLVTHIREHYDIGAGQTAQLKQLEENLSEARQANNGLETAKIELISQNADLVKKLESQSKDYDELKKSFDELRAAAEKYHTFAFTDVKQVLDENKQGGKKNGR